MWHACCQCAVPACLEMSRLENVPHCPCVAVHLIELSHDPLSSGYVYDSVPPGQAVMEHDSGLVHFTYDVWTSSNMRRFLRITCHFLDNEWNFHSEPMSFSELDGPHTGENIGQTLLAEIKKMVPVTKAHSWLVLSLIYCEANKSELDWLCCV